MNNSTFGKRFRPVRFFCGECGRELFMEMELASNKTWTLEGMVEDSVCSDCIMAMAIAATLGGHAGEK